MGFQGADVDGLDKLAAYTNDAADFAESVAKALEIIAAALDAMSWTGWAAAFAAYLRGVVIPWVKTTGRYLRAFAAVLALASKEQKEVSGDVPRVALPVGSWTPTTYPTQSAVIAPRLVTPSPAITVQTAGGGATGDTVRISAPTPIGTVQAPGGGASGGGATVLDPGHAPVGQGAVVGATGGGSRATGGAAPSFPMGPGPGGATGGGAVGAGLGALGLGGGTGGGGAASGSSGADVPFATGSGAVGGTGPSGAAAPAGGSGGHTGPVTAGSPSLGGGGLGGGVPGAGAEEPTVRAGDPPVSRTPVSLGGGPAVQTTAGAVPLPEIDDADGASFAPALAAAPLGLAGLGAAAMGAARRGAGGGPAADGDEDRPGAGDEEV